jgi:hypothetical protein
MVDNRQLFLFKNYVEHISREKIHETVPGLVRRIYILFEEETNTEKMNVVYIGRATEGKKQGVGARLVAHEKNKKKSGRIFLFSKSGKCF